MGKKEITISVVGAGASGTILVNQLVEKFSRVSGVRIRIILIEKSGRFGPGLAYSTPLESHIINMRANTMGGKVGQSDHFSRWMTGQETSIQRTYPGFSAAKDEYPPRRIYGQYLEDFFREALERADQSHIDIEPLQGEALDLDEKRSGLDLVLGDGSNLASDVIILAPGNFPPTLFQELRGVEGYLHYPWPVSPIIENIPPDRPVSVLGSGLSAIDTLFTLLENGHRERITFLSRNGFLPKVQGRPTNHTLKLLRQDHIDNLLREEGSRTLPLDRMAQLFYREIEEAEGKSIDWLHLFNPTGAVDQILGADIEKARKGPLPYQGVLSATEPVIGRLWNTLSIEDQCRFDRDFKSFWTVYRHPMPLINAQKVLDVLKTGQLDVLSGCGCIRSCGPGRGFEIDIETRFDIPFLLKTPYLINATGQGLDVMCFRDPFIQNLLSKGFIQPHPRGGIRVDFHTSQVIDQGENRRPDIFALGEITRGVHFFTNGVAPNVLAADSITDHILKEITGPADP